MNGKAPAFLFLILQEKGKRFGVVKKSKNP
jgi:hypothetical protein